MRIPLTLLLLISLGAFVSCNRDRGDNEGLLQIRKLDDTASRVKSTVQEPEPQQPRTTYRVLHLNDSVRRALPDTYDAEQLKTILALNRIDQKFLRRRDSIVVPETFLSSFIAYAPFPHKLTIADSIPKLLLCSYPSQSFAAYENGRLVRWGPTSLGKKSTPTPTGMFHTNWKAKRTISTVNSEWILDWYFNLTNFGGVSLHQYELPGYPASHACIRLREEDAYWIYHWADQWRLTPDQRSVTAHGTPTFIYGTYDFGAPPPWFALPHNPGAVDDTVEKLNALIEPQLELIMKRKAVRDSVLNSMPLALVTER